MTKEMGLYSNTKGLEMFDAVCDELNNESVAHVFDIAVYLAKNLDRHTLAQFKRGLEYVKG